MSPQEKLVEVLQAEVGVREEGGPNKGARVEEYQKAVDNKAAGESWCMALMQWAIKKVEAELGVASKIFRAEHCLTVWNKTPKSCRVDPQHIYPGCIVVWQHGNTSNGHTGVVVKDLGKTFASIEGNTSAGPGVERNGDGVYSRVRSKQPTGEMKVLGFFDPFKS